MIRVRIAVPLCMLTVMQLAFAAAALPSAAEQFQPVDSGTRGEGPGSQAPSDLSQPNAPDCATPVSEGPYAEAFAPQENSGTTRHVHKQGKDRTHEGRSAISNDPTPTLQADTAFCTSEAAQRYHSIADHGGWPVIPGPLRQDARPDDIKLLRERLYIEGDLPQDESSQNGWDEALTNALKSFQRRAGLQQSGEVDEATLKALNVPAGTRARELESSAKRIANIKIPFDQRYVVVNIPSASVEAVEDGRAVQRRTAIAGKIGDQSPQLTASIQGITLNPTWTIPRSIVEKEVIPKLRRDPHYLSRARLVVVDRRGHRVRRIHWSKAASLTFRQEPGSKNALGRLRIDMPNREEVFMHDTPLRRLFADNYRYLSHGCVRVDGIYDLASWLLGGANAQTRWDPEAIADAVRGGERRKIKLSNPVPVAWVYLDAWESADGMVHFAPDVYHLDSEKRVTVLRP